MITRAQLQKKAFELGAEVSETERSADSSREFYIEAPKGKVWGTGNHAILVSYFTYVTGDREKAFGYAMKDMSLGLENCTDPDCDICNPE